MIEAAMLVTMITAGITFVRLILGPSHPDRVVATSVIGTMIFALILLLSMFLNEPTMIDVALVYAVLQFVDLVVYAKYLGRRAQR